MVLLRGSEGVSMASITDIDFSAVATSRQRVAWPRSLQQAIKEHFILTSFWWSSSAAQTLGHSVNWCAGFFPYHAIVSMFVESFALTDLGLDNIEEQVLVIYVV